MNATQGNMAQSEIWGICIARMPARRMYLESTRSLRPVLISRNRQAHTPSRLCVLLARLIVSIVVTLALSCIFCALAPFVNLFWQPR